MRGHSQKRLKQALYRLAARLPPGLRRRLGASPATRALRDRFFRPGGEPELVSDTISWMDLRFPFTAPYQVLEKARARGVENRICRLARSLLGPGDLAVDVGANYGFVTMVAAHSVAPGGRVISFEIEPRICRALRGSIDAAGLADTVRLVERGAGAVDEEGNEGDAGAGLVRVDTVLDGLDLERFRFLKVDVDGLDLDVLRGAAESLRRAKPTVVIEMTRDGAEIYALLRELGYSRFMDQDNRAFEPDGPDGPWPENLIASDAPVRIPDRSP